MIRSTRAGGTRMEFMMDRTRTIIFSFPTVCLLLFFLILYKCINDIILYFS